MSQDNTGVCTMPQGNAGTYTMPDPLDGTLVFRLGYDGAAFSGFAEQLGIRTVAGELRRALETFLRRPIDLTCAGRTDAGVHAIAQYVSVPATEAELAITRSRWMRAMAALLPHAGELGEEHLAFTITGNAFLHSMVRTIVGSLVEVGAHRRDPAWLAEALAACDRRAAGPTAPARGLCFMAVTYDEGALTPIA